MAAGIAALEDTAHVEQAIAHNEQHRGWLAQDIGALGIKTTASAGNFLLLHFESPAEAAAADAHLTRSGLILRAVGAYGLPQCLRLTVGTEEANRLVVAALADFASQTRADG